ncbi:putative DNA modification/repair radical SAM protein [Methylopila jiangsuensis]|uniref:DNA modification/repair radical SAM protein n=1 Tax=Methylopila jiangsuensis TaxID=586230 RepID=A0A9W6JFQ8_9HYPH|nr:putative DNA modification/repair radical SAM protein [Methylopila jiangsuensis]MDR6284276.1 putative DNA modification/repair radical SAM protein [Methylopila jiangsuensis]GLK76207.1 putative DNA modification/repair radical SAM protein [Methylopila jiangsuensis]
MDLAVKLSILADAAKYDASCASSGTDRRHSGPARPGGQAQGLGSTEGAGICHSYAPDGRCISLLKILLTNACAFDCLYCVNRASSNVRRARFTVKEVVDLTLDFYRRNYIEGLFLSSGIVRSADYTMEQVVRVAKSLRLDHGFRGYIHLKTIPDADPALLAEAGLYADRLSINLELPTEAGLSQLAPEKDARAVRRTMAQLRGRIEEAKAEARAPRFSPAGQSTQMIIGADDSDDRATLETSANLYGSYRLKRVYYSAFSPIPDASSRLPSKAPPLMREHRLYQADWLMRFYGFSVHEITEADGMLDLALDPKLAWALRHRGLFPLDVNRASREELLRTPGLGRTTVERILSARRFRALRVEDLKRMRAPLGKALPFLATIDHRPRVSVLDAANLRDRLVPPPRQLALGL